MKAPLSPAQERLWVLQRLKPDNSAYNCHLVRRLRGPLHRAAVDRAVALVAARHESLRTRFVDEEGVPWAVAGPPPTVDWRRAGSEAEAEELVAELVGRPFDLSAGPPVRISMIELGPLEHVLCVVPHHIIVDGWSLQILLADLAECYDASVAGREPRLAPLPIQPSDYARWQRRRDERAVPFWLERLADPPPPDLPFRAVGAASGRGGFHLMEIPPEVVRGLERVGRERRATLFMVLTAAYMALISRHTGQRDVLVGTAVAARERAGLEAIVGFVSQVVALRGDLSDDPGFAELVDRTRADAVTALGRPGVPFERFAQPAETLVPSLFILHNQTPGKDGSFGGLTMSQFESGYRQAKVDLNIDAWHDGSRILISFNYDTALFREADVRLMGERFLRLLESAAADPRVPVSRLAMADPVAAPVVEPVREAAFALGGEPDAVALICGDERVTYGELDTRVEEIARGLSGVRPGDLVGVCLPRSVEAIATLLAVWRLGAAYLPLDPDDPDDRIALLAEPAHWIVTSEGVTQGAGTLRYSGAAYVIPTSGTTGVPRGVIAERAGVEARVAWMREAYQIGPRDRVVQFSALSFDAHVEEVFPALAAGAALVLLPDGAATLPDLLRSGPEVTVLDLPTAYWHRLVDVLDEIAWPPGLRLVVLGGEQVMAASVERWRDRFGDTVRLVNSYGPTEGTVIATIADLGAEDARRRPSIGAAIGGASAVVLDDQGLAAPAGVVGELALGGVGVARGYVGLPGLTASRFVPDPYNPGGRRYLTGDRARWRSDGQLEFLGRTDDQLKVRGFRIEPGEVESHLLAHPEVAQAYVTARQDDLVAYYAGTADPADLRADLVARLPRQLVPTVWARMDALPLTKGGKVDRAALPEPGRPGAAERVLPRTDAEGFVAAIWCGLLGVPEVGVFEDFFELGGHSLLATRMAARIRAGLGVEVPIRTLFDKSTVAELAEVLEDLLLAEMAED
ncbi:condensation domain-containing protein [Acrocarpospora sp. B8E8]|uniref:condensation domain-containing protein n=1 Tax=Acrocarpospora sp. B8E8 TaxID=3153572 RepID=UPI00325F19D2